ncbi:precorrin-6y C5,15-methyltransferase (decarboxylating) subunit CbiE [uncultured Cetobacterium sp.]|uniref:precorrin-6y C5,15-methyltransferase (decarboxylating) subunit CbiE n=1 Tax=uncultured Cetobacterium sp. TaxID=527638 RepID=UPI00262E6241|nr:precorrin-6y C5,15-methyltransferase (decarboxylating) subunit CbiE [uncultured Cetobacterium sp.]
MSHNICVVGLGPGNIEFITGAGVKSIIEADIVIGGKRQLDEIKTILKDQETYTLGKLDLLKTFILENENQKIAVIVSGDTGYYSLLTYLKRTFSQINFKVIPGISSFQYLFSKLEMTWENFSLHSVHGRDFNYVKEILNSNKGVVLLTDSINNPIKIAKDLLEKGIENIEVIIGERLSSSDECITRFKIKDYEKYNRNYLMNVTILRKI